MPKRYLLSACLSILEKLNVSYLLEVPLCKYLASPFLLATSHDHLTSEVSCMSTGARFSVSQFPISSGSIKLSRSRLLLCPSEVPNHAGFEGLYLYACPMGGQELWTGAT